MTRIKRVVILGMNWVVLPVIIALMLIVSLRSFAPHHFDSDEVKMAVEAAAIWNFKKYLSQDYDQEVLREGRIIYLEVDDDDPDEQFLAEVRQLVPQVDIRPFSKRDASNDKCGPRDDGFMSTFPCEEDNFVRVRLDSMPLWRTSIVSIRTAACGTDATLIKLGRWMVVSDRWWCV